MAYPPGHNARERLRRDVALMRELGVTRWGAIELGPDPTPQSSPETQSRPAQRERIVRNGGLSRIPLPIPD